MSVSKPEKNVQSRCVILDDSDDFQYAILKLADNLVKQNTCAENARNFKCYFARLVLKSITFYSITQSKNNQPRNLETADKTIKYVSDLWSFISGSNCIMLDHYHYHWNTDFPRPFSIQVNWFVLQKNIFSHQTPQTIVQSDWLRNNRHMSQNRNRTDAVTCQQVGGKVFCLGDSGESSCSYL